MADCFSLILAVHGSSSRCFTSIFVVKTSVLSEYLSAQPENSDRFVYLSGYPEPLRARPLR